MTDRPILFSAPMVRAILEGRKTQTRRVVKLDNLHANVLHTVRGDGPFRDIIAKPGKHKLHANRNFAVSAVLKDKKLGLRPGEFNFLTPYAGECHADTDNRRWMLLPLETSRLWVRETFGTYTDGCAHTEMPGAPDESWECGFVYRADGTEDQEPFDGVFSGWKPSIHMPRRASRISLEVTGMRVERLHDITEADARAEGVETDEFMEELDRRPPKYGPAIFDADESRRHRRYCQRKGWCEYEQYLEATRPWHEERGNQLRGLKESPREKAERILRERGLAPRSAAA